MARKATERQAVEAPIGDRSHFGLERPRPPATDAEIYSYADEVLGSTLLQKLQLNVLDRRRVQALADVLGKPVRGRRLKRPSDRAQHIYGDPYSADAEAFLSACWGFIEFFTARESINSDKLIATVADSLRSALRRMNEEDRKKTIAGLMAYIGELQTAGVLEATPSDRLARVAKLIGEAAEIVSANPSKFVPLFGDRPIDPATGKKPTALEWFDQVWKPRVDAGEVLGADMKRADPAFYSTLSSTLSRKNQKLTDLLPPSPTGRPRNPGPTDARLEHARELNRKRAARWRAGKRAPESETPPPPVWQKEQSSALEWFDINWRPRIEAESLFSDDLKRADPQLYSALAAAQTRAGASLGDLIPLRRRRLSDLSPDELAERDARIRSQHKMKMRRRRAAPKPN